MDGSLTGATLLVGIDFSAYSERALLRAVALAEKDGAQIELIHVFEWDGGRPPCGRGEAEGWAGPADFLWNAVVAQAQATLSQLVQIASFLVGDRVSAQLRVVIGEPVAELLSAAQRAGAPLIVLGAHGRRTLPHGLVGTTAERVYASSVVPVLLVP